MLAAGDLFKMAEHYFTVEPSSRLKLRTLRASLLGLEFRFLTAPGVFSYRRVDTGTRVLIESMKMPESGIVLDLGCGWGLIGITIAATHPNVRVIMTDVNKRAVWLASENVRLNHVAAEVRWGNLFESLRGMKFDTVVTNPPVSAGLSLNTKAIEEAYHNLNRCGTLQLVVRSRKGSRAISKIMEDVFGNTEVIGKKSGYRVYCSCKTNESREEQFDKRI